MIHQTFDLIALGHIGLNDSVVTKRKRLGKCLKPVNTPRSQHEFGAVFGKMPGGCFAEPVLAPVMTTTLSLMP